MPLLTEEQYLAIERAAEFKCELHDGQMFEREGASWNHALLSSHIMAILHRQMPSESGIFTSDLRIRVASGRLYSYPDCSVACGELELFGDQQDVLANPLLLVEVLSPSTSDYDRGKKFELYRTIPSFREYLIIHQDWNHVEHWSKQDYGGWLLHEYTGAESTVVIARLGVQISLAELYASASDLS